MRLVHERMSGAFEKWHVEGLPRAAVLHRFGDIDRGDSHDHPWPFRSIVISGGYVEQVYQLDGSTETIHRRPGDSFEIPATHIHRIVELPEGECWTLVLPGSHERTSRFWQFRDDGAWSRAWHEHEWKLHKCEHKPRDRS